jgi:hypothetical protein
VCGVGIGAGRVGLKASTRLSHPRSRMLEETAGFIGLEHPNALARQVAPVPHNHSRPNGQKHSKNKAHTFVVFGKTASPHFQIRVTNNSAVVANDSTSGNERFAPLNVGQTGVELEEIVRYF